MLNQLADNYGARKSRKRVGRGIGSGLGKTSGKGHKGQKARAGISINGFEGGQMPLHMRLPKRGFKSLNKVIFEVVNLGQLEAAVAAKKINAGAIVSKDLLAEIGLIRNAKLPVKLLAKGQLDSKLDVHVDVASEAAAAAVAKAGGKLVLSAPTAAPKKAE